MQTSRQERLKVGLQRLERALTRLNEALLFVAVAIVLIFTFGQALDRYWLKTSFSAHDQVAKIGLVWLVFTGAAAAYARRENLRIDLFARHLPVALVRWRDRVLEVMILVIALIVHVKAWRVLDVAAFQQILGTPFTNVLPYSAILLGTAATAVSCIVRLLAPDAPSLDWTHPTSTSSPSAERTGASG